MTPTEGGVAWIKRRDITTVVRQLACEMLMDFGELQPRCSDCNPWQLTEALLRILLPRL
jgi:hypothetical protein